MKSLILAAVSAATLLVVPAAASAAPGAADDNSWYVRGDAGGTFDARIDGTNGPKSDTGWTLDGGVGKSFGNGWRAEGQLLYLDNSGKSGAGDTKVFGGFANGFYDFLPGSQWRPFLGAGIGVAQVKEDNGPATAPHGDKTVFAYQLQAGIAHPFNDQLTGEVAYHYLGAPSVKFGSDTARVNGDFGASLVTVGLRYKFGG
ncbi:MAG TPA: outer membrane beta-barrel protein [Phenylobacterium sp.]|jgi:opacity protein-like surface antigen|uniref:outer membrane protein n=1 Tax=Phenylobacterium sp. TaxID=1871053 RepID=UPI002D35FB51|nr:outer membrane beta-barrel protein [Phenylobacterium sp.]HZZ68492.1 outer membrane beta-barrel protein [Phenylobacterium sp.]